MPCIRVELLGEVEIEIESEAISSILRTIEYHRRRRRA